MKYKQTEYGDCVYCGKNIIKNRLISTSQGSCCSALCASKAIIGYIEALHNELKQMVSWFDDYKECKK